MSDILDYFEYIIQKHEKFVDNPPIKIYINKVKNRIEFEIKTGYHLEHWMPETMSLLGSTETIIMKDKNGKFIQLI